MNKKGDEISVFDDYASRKELSGKRHLLYSLVNFVRCFLTFEHITRCNQIKKSQLICNS